MPSSYKFIRVAAVLCLLTWMSCKKDPPPLPPPPTPTLTVHPGDANNDGLVDGWDVLRIGRFFGDKVDVRANGSASWVPQSFVIPSTLSDSLLPYADANGDGEVNLDDYLTPFLSNWDKNHSRATTSLSTTTASTGIPMYIRLRDTLGRPLPDTLVLSPTQPAVIDVGLELNATPALYGLAFQVLLPSQLTTDAQVFVFDTLGGRSGLVNFMGEPDNQLIIFSDSLPLVFGKTSFADKKIDISITDTDQLDNFAAGFMGCIIVAIDDISKRSDTVEVIFEFDQVRAVKSDGSPVLLQPIADTLIVAKQ